MVPIQSVNIALTVLNTLYAKVIQLIPSLGYYGFKAKISNAMWLNPASQVRTFKCYMEVTVFFP